jgi:hypothetical protein
MYTKDVHIDFSHYTIPPLQELHCFIVMNFFVMFLDYFALFFIVSLAIFSLILALMDIIIHIAKVAFQLKYFFQIKHSSQ